MNKVHHIFIKETLNSFLSVGGIYTVIKSKAQVSTDELGEQYCLMGPYNESCVRTEVELLEPHHYVMREVLSEMRDAGMKVCRNYTHNVSDI